jgi:hypothetical protein
MIKGNAHRLDDGQPAEVMLLEEFTTFRDGQWLDPSGHLPSLTGSGLAGGGDWSLSPGLSPEPSNSARLNGAGAAETVVVRWWHYHRTIRSRLIRP